MESWLILQRGTLKAEATFWGQLVIVRMKERPTIMVGCCTQCLRYSVYSVLSACCTRCMLYSVYAVLGVCCTRCMLYSVLTHDHGMER